MRLGIILFIIGLISTVYFLKITQKKVLIKRIAMVVSILLVLYGLILSVQPKEYIKFTKSTISTKK